MGMVLMILWAPAGGAQETTPAASGDGWVRLGLPIPGRDALDVRVIPFADGLAREGMMLPQKVLLANQGRATSVSLLQREVGPGFEQIDHLRTIELAEGARKEATLFVLSGSITRPRTMEIRADHERSGVVEYAVRMLGEDDVGIAILGDAQVGVSGVLNTWANPVPSHPLRSSDPRSVRAGLVAPRHAPDRAQGWSVVDWVVWPEADPTDLSAAQLDGLLAWVASGGHLWMSVSDQPARLRGSPLEKALPIALGDVETLPGGTLLARERLAMDTPFTRATAVDQPLRHVEVLEEWDGSALWTVGEYGLGSITAVTINPSTAGFDGSQRHELWRRWLWLPDADQGSSAGRRGALLRGEPQTKVALGILMDHPSCDVSDNPVGEGPWFDFVRGWLSDIPGVAPLPLSWLMLFAGLYLFCIGPFDYFVLRWVGRQPWTWVTFPLYVCIFAAVAFVGTVQTKGRQAVMNQLEVVEVLPGTPWMRGTAYRGLFSANKTDVTLSSEYDNALVVPFADGGFLTNPRIVSTSSSGALSYRAETWTLGYLRSTWMERHSPQRVLVKRLGGGQFEVRSELAIALDDAMLVADDTTYAIGELRPGQSVVVSEPGAYADSDFLALQGVSGDIPGFKRHIGADLVMGVQREPRDGGVLEGLEPRTSHFTLYRVPVRIQP